MKLRGLFLVWLALVAILCSCEDLVDLDGLLEDFNVGFNTQYYDVELAIPPAPEGMEIVMETPVDFDLEQQLLNNGYQGVSVSSIKVSDASLEVIEGSNIIDLDPIDYVSTAVSTQILPSEMLASGENSIPGATTLPMETSGADLKEYLLDSEYFVTTTGMLRETTTDTLRVRGKIRFRVSMNVESL